MKRKFIAVRPQTLAQVKREYILSMLTLTGNNKTHAAELLGMKLRTLHNELNRMGYWNPVKRGQGEWDREAK